ncbi:MAG: hypothetical protein ACI4JN_05585 [Ruminococcus sp.]
MLAAQRKKLMRSIIIEIVIILVICIANISAASRISVKMNERAIYHDLIYNYPTLIYDRDLTRIAEDCAKQCYCENYEAQDIKILSNEDFVRLYSRNVRVAKYTASLDSDQEFADVFISAMREGEYPETNECMKKCQNIGIGIYKNQVFLLAFYKI